MIIFDCSKCGHTFNIEDEHAGKKGRCPKCNEVVVVPQLASQGIAEDSSDSLEDTSFKIPVLIWYLIGVTSVFVIGILLYLFVFRDTWEIDHSSEVSQLIRETQQCISEDNSDGAANNYNQLSALIGDRQLKRECLKDDYADINKKYKAYEKETKLKQEKIAEEARLYEERKHAEEARLAELRKAEERILKMTPLERLMELVSYIGSIDNDSKNFNTNIIKEEPYILNALNIEETSTSFFKKLALIDSAKRQIFAKNNPEVKVKFQTLITPSYEGRADRNFLMAALHDNNLGWKLSSQDECFLSVRSLVLEEVKRRRKNHINAELIIDALLYYGPLISYDMYTPSSQTYKVKFHFGNIEDSGLILDHLKYNYILLTWELDLADISDSVIDDQEQYGHERLEQYEYNAYVYEYQLIDKDHPYVKKFIDERMQRWKINEIEAKELEVKLSMGQIPKHDESRSEHVKQVAIKQRQRMQELEIERERRLQEQQNLPHAIVENILNKSDAFRSATFTGTTDKGSGEISYNYEVEYITKGGFIRLGTFNVAIVNGKCREVYFNGEALWISAPDPRLQGYRDPYQ